MALVYQDFLYHLVVVDGALTHWGWVKIDNSKHSNWNRELEPKLETQVGRRRLAGVWQDTKY